VSGSSAAFAIACLADNTLLRPQDQLIGHCLLKIFHSTVSSMNKSPFKMTKELQAALTLNNRIHNVITKKA